MAGAVSETLAFYGGETQNAQTAYNLTAAASDQARWRNDGAESQTMRRCFIDR